MSKVFSEFFKRFIKELCIIYSKMGPTEVENTSCVTREVSQVYKKDEEVLDVDISRLQFRNKHVK